MLKDFRSWYKEYDKYIDKICPDYNIALDILVKNIPHGTDKIIELGCGTGNLTEILAKNLPKSKIYAIDNNSLLLDIANEKLKKYENVILINQDISDSKFNENDVIVSSLVFHLLPKKQRKAIFERLCKSKVKSIYMFDRLKEEFKQEEHKYKAYFKNNLIKNKLPSEFINELVEENRTNNPDKLSEQINFFSKRNYSLNIIFRNPNHKFMVYQIKKTES